MPTHHSCSTLHPSTPFPNPFPCLLCLVNKQGNVREGRIPFGISAMEIKTLPRVILPLPSLSEHGSIQIKNLPKYSLILEGRRIFPAHQGPGHGSAGQGFPRQSYSTGAPREAEGRLHSVGERCWRGCTPRKCTWRCLGCILGLLLLL